MLKNVTDSAKDISSTVEKIDANNLQNEVNHILFLLSYIFELVIFLNTIKLDEHICI